MGGSVRRVLVAVAGGLPTVIGIVLLVPARPGSAAGADTGILKGYCASGTSWSISVTASIRTAEPGAGAVEPVRCDLDQPGTVKAGGPHGV
jgi:hypothetical protein